jgi:hydrogenase maturation protease
LSGIRTLVLGLGNILMRDEGVGVRAVERLAACYDCPSEVTLLDGGTLGLDLLPYLEEADRLLVIDAVDLGAEPGTLARLAGEQVPAVLSVKVSPHQVGLADLLAAARLRGVFPEEVVLLGIQPEIIEVGLDLSPRVATQVDTLVADAVAELKQWGADCATKQEEEKEGNGLCQ